MYIVVCVFIRRQTHQHNATQCLICTPVCIVNYKCYEIADIVWVYCEVYFHPHSIFLFFFCHSFSAYYIVYVYMCVLPAPLAVTTFYNSPIISCGHVGMFCVLQAIGVHWTFHYYIDVWNSVSSTIWIFILQTSV